MALNKHILSLSMELKEFLLLSMAQFNAEMSGQMKQEGKCFASLYVGIGDLSNISHWKGKSRMFPGRLRLRNSLSSPVTTRPGREV